MSEVVSQPAGRDKSNGKGRVRGPTHVSHGKPANEKKKNNIGQRRNRRIWREELEAWERKRWASHGPIEEEQHAAYEEETPYEEERSDAGNVQAKLRHCEYLPPEQKATPISVAMAVSAKCPRGGAHRDAADHTRAAEKGSYLGSLRATWKAFWAAEAG